MMRTLIIGGGAAGMAAAVAAARAGQAVTVLERGRRPLKKLGVTGNGRGNLLNAGAPDYPGGASFAAQMLAAMPYDRLAAFWEDLGVPLRLEEEGRVYPASLLASAAVDALLLAARRLGVEIIVNARVAVLDRLPGGGFEAQGTVCRYLPDVSKKSGKTRPGALAEESPARWRGDRVIVAAGGEIVAAAGDGLRAAAGRKLNKGLDFVFSSREKLVMRDLSFPPAEGMSGAPVGCVVAVPVTVHGDVRGEIIAFGDEAEKNCCEFELAAEMLGAVMEQ